MPSAPAKAIVDCSASSVLQLGQHGILETQAKQEGGLFVDERMYHGIQQNVRGPAARECQFTIGCSMLRQRAHQIAGRTQVRQARQLT